MTYWKELRRIFDWTQTHVHRSFTICWAAQAALQHFYGVPKHALERKLFGVFRQQVLEPTSPYLRGFSDSFSVPVSRWTEVRRRDIAGDRGLVVLAESGDTGVCLVDDPRHRALHVFNHFEYDTSSLADEYVRDVAARRAHAPPAGLFHQRRSRRAACRTAGAATPTCSSRTGSTRSTRPRPSTCAQSATALPAAAAGRPDGRHGMTTAGSAGQPSPIAIRLALPPAAAVLIEITCSWAKRVR